MCSAATRPQPSPHAPTYQSLEEQGEGKDDSLPKEDTHLPGSEDRGSELKHGYLSPGEQLAETTMQAFQELGTYTPGSPRPVHGSACHIAALAAG